MDKKDLYTLNLKLKRHKLKFDYDPEKDSIELAGVKADVKTPIIALLMILLGIAILLVMIFVIKMRIRIVSGLIAGTPIAAGVVMFGNLIRRRKDNKNRKIITREHIYLSNKKSEITIPTSDIARIAYRVDGSGDSHVSNGHLFAQLKSGEEVKLLGLMGENIKYLDDDFAYAQRIISRFLGLS